MNDLRRKQVSYAFNMIAKANTVSILTLDEMEAIVLRALSGEFDHHFAGDLLDEDKKLERPITRDEWEAARQAIAQRVQNIMLVAAYDIANEVIERRMNGAI